MRQRMHSIGLSQRVNEVTDVDVQFDQINPTTMILLLVQLILSI